MIRDRVEPVALGRPAEVNEGAGIRDARKGPHQQRVRDGEDRGVRPKADRERERRGNGEERALPKQPSRESYVLHPVVEHAFSLPENTTNSFVYAAESGTGSSKHAPGAPNLGELPTKLSDFASNG